LIAAQVPHRATGRNTVAPCCTAGNPSAACAIGSLLPCFTRPISIVLASAILLTVLLRVAYLRSTLVALVARRKLRAGE
jgi:hypothetical protein